MAVQLTRMTIAAVSATILTPVWALAQQSDSYRQYYGPPMMGWGGGWYGMMFGPLFMILLLAVVIAVAVLLVRWLGGQWQGTYTPHHRQQTGPAALDILKERFARGEIDKDEFEERRRLLID